MIVESIAISHMFSYQGLKIFANSIYNLWRGSYGFMQIYEELPTLSNFVGTVALNNHFS